VRARGVDVGVDRRLSGEDIRAPVHLPERRTAAGAADVGADAAEVVEVQGGQGAVLPATGFYGEDVAGTVPGRMRLLLPVERDLDRAVQAARGDRRQHRVLVHPQFAAEPAAAVQGDHPNVGERNPEALGQRLAVRMYRLGRVPHRQLAGLPVRDTAVGLEAGVHLVLRPEGLLDDEIGLRQARLQVAATVGPGMAGPDIAGVVDRRCAVAGRFLGVGDEGQLLVLDIDQAHRLGGVRQVQRHDRGDLVADESQGGVEEAGVAAVPGEILYVVGGQHQPDSGKRPRPAGVDALDPGVRHRAAQDLHP
jgi:hypothetical protein